MNIPHILIFIFLTVLSFESALGSICLQNFTDANPKNVYFEGQILNITIQTSNRLSQQLFNEVLRILLQDALGYERVNFIKNEAPSNVMLMIENLFESPENIHLHRKIPNALINLEVPVTPYIDYKSSLEVYLFTECGNIAPPGRYGWFIPNQLFVNSPGANHWDFFTDQHRTHVFDLDVKYKNILKTYASLDEKFYCDKDYCEDGYFIPEYCEKTYNNNSCALLLTSYPETTGFIVDHIKKFKLRMKVVWLGNNLKEAVDKITLDILQNDYKKSLLFLEWTPGYFTYEHEKFTSVYLPRCSDYNSTDSPSCMYEITRNVKFVWSELRNIAKPAFELVYKMSFDFASYKNLFDIYTTARDKSMREIACDWIDENTPIWSKWIPLSLEKKNLYIGGIFPLTGVQYSANGIVLAARMAQDAINQNATLLRDYNLKVLVNDGQCRADMVLKTFIDYIYHNEYRDLVGILGPACSETLEPLAGVSRHYSTIVISYSAEGSSFSDRTRYPYFFRSIGENDHYKYVYLQLFQNLGWKRVAALTEDGQKYTEYISSMGNLLEKNEINLIANSKFSKNSEESALIRHLENLKEKRARIIIADIYDNFARRIMCLAHNLEMTGKHGYVWFLPPWLSHNWYNTTHFNAHFNETVNCSTEIMIQAISGYFSLEHAAFAPDDFLMEENITVAMWREKYTKRITEWSRIQTVKSANKTKIPTDNMSDYAGYAYDAVWLYALAVEELLKMHPESLSDIHSEFTTMQLVNIIQNIEFNGVSGRIKFYGGPSRLTTINIKQWVNESVIVGHFLPNVSHFMTEMDSGTLYLNMSKIKWQTESTPDDGFLMPDVCILQPLVDALNITCENAIIMVNVLSFALFGSFLLMIFILLKRRYDRKIKLTEDYMKAIGFDRNISAINFSSLDKWETSRECVVLNRKLGEGAFGTVYGGEALLSEGDGWAAVAVKTLKLGSSREEKLDFLSEAECMKRFDHKNIVRLLGVCTKNEPFYTIMEYMLYGDLKTYLLARRHLVKGPYVEEKEEISSKKLTIMAMDIARALNYLAELKYVHRDVACRNCLVNAQRVVKLGDFGMSRLIFENDYYRFNRKGMLPVRWMAPESLCFGIFTPASDVWSFGILLYEIITFGNFPFQGLSNNEVLEHVKSGQTLTIPSGVKPQLEGLMKSCWNMDYKMRPQASQIAEFLANNPRLLTPCLDVPLSSVEMEFDDVDQFPDIMETSLNEDDTYTPENNITNVTMLNSLHFDNPSYIVAETNKENLRRSNMEHHNDDEVIPLV